MVSEDKLKEDIAVYVNNFVTERFPSLTKELETVIREVVFDAFLGGVQYAEAYIDDKKKSRIIT